MKTAGTILPVLAVVAAFGVALPAEAAFPGANGRIGYAVEVYPTLSDAESYHRIATILSDGTKPRALGPSAVGPVAFSPDGRRIAYVESDPWERNIWISPVCGRRRSRRLTNLKWDTAAASSPDWSPSGRRIVFQRSPDDGPAELWIHYFKGKRLLTEGSGPAWSVRGDIAFTGSTPSGGGIFVIRPDGSGLRQISKQGGSPDWSPDGKEIVFAIDSQIALMRADGSGVRRLDVSGREPSFSPDGKQIVFLRGSGVLTMTAAGRRVRLLRSHLRYEFEDWGTTVYPPDWQPRPRPALLRCGRTRTSSKTAWP